LLLEPPPLKQLLPLRVLLVPLQVQQLPPPPMLMGNLRLSPQLQLELQHRLQYSFMGGMLTWPLFRLVLLLVLP
jgi:hypothetical protein